MTDNVVDGQKVLEKRRATADGLLEGVSWKAEDGSVLSLDLCRYHNDVSIITMCMGLC